MPLAECSRLAFRRSSLGISPEILLNASRNSHAVPCPSFQGHYYCRLHYSRPVFSDKDSHWSSSTLQHKLKNRIDILNGYRLIKSKYGEEKQKRSDTERIDRILNELDKVDEQNNETNCYQKDLDGGGGLGKDDTPGKVPDEAMINNTKAHFYFSKGLYDEAAECMEKSLQLVENNLGKNHIEAATLMVNLSQVHEKRKEYKKSESYLRRALEIRQLWDGADHTSVAIVLYKLSFTLSNLRDIQNALIMVTQAEQIMELNMARIRQKMDEYKEKRLDIPHELKQRNMILEIEQGHVWNVRGVLYYQNREFQKSCEDWDRSVIVWKKALLKDECIASLVLDVHKNLVTLYKTINRLEAATQAADNCIIAIEDSFPTSPILPFAYQLAAQVHERAQNLDLASVSWEKACSLAKNIYGDGEEMDEFIYSLNVCRSKLAASKPKQDIPPS